MKRCINCMEEKPEGQSVCPYCGYDEEITEERIDQLKPGSVLNDRFVIGRPLGRGGFGITYIAWDRSLYRKVAIKEYLPKGMAMRNTENTTVSYDEDSREAFLRGVEKTLDESRRLAGLSELESVVNVYDCFKANGTAYIVMELLSGQNIKEKLNRDGAFSFEETMKIIKPVLETLAEVHRAGIIHRDISPDNIFICDNGKIKLLDFGSAKVTEGNEEKSRTIILKRGYAPKEQYIAKSVQGPYTDIYSISATIYKMLTGKTPPDGLDRALEPEEDRLGDIAELAKLPAPAAAAIMKGMAIEPRDRIQTADELLEELLRQDKKPDDYDDAEETRTLQIDPMIESRFNNIERAGDFEGQVPAEKIAALNPPGQVQPEKGKIRQEKRPQVKEKKPEPATIPVEAKKGKGKTVFLIILAAALLAAALFGAYEFFGKARIVLEREVEVMEGRERRIDLELIDRIGNSTYYLTTFSDNKAVATSRHEQSEDSTKNYIIVKGESAGETTVTVILHKKETNEDIDIKYIKVTVTDKNGNKPEPATEVGSPSENAGPPVLNVADESADIVLGDSLYIKYTVENGAGYEVTASSENTGRVEAETVSDDDGEWVLLECYGEAGASKVFVQLSDPSTGEILDTKTIAVTVMKPAGLEQYEGNLEYSGKTYRVTTKNKGAQINYRRSPVVTEKGPKDNIAGKLTDGDEIEVDYIYDGTWAVFNMGGETVFASVYNNNNPLDYEILKPID